MALLLGALLIVLPREGDLAPLSHHSCGALIVGLNSSPYATTSVQAEWAPTTTPAIAKFVNWDAGWQVVKIYAPGTMLPAVARVPR